MLHAACYKSKREVERQVAALRPRPDVVASVRKLPQPKTTKSHSAALLDAAPSDVARDNDATARPGEAPAAMAAVLGRPSAPSLVKPLAP